MNIKTIKLLPLLLLLSAIAVSQNSERSVFHANQGSNNQWHIHRDNHRALYRVITNESFKQLDERAENIAELDTEDEWKAYREKVRKVLCQPLEKFTKTPLNARTTGILERETFSVEKVLFESHPGFYVTAGLFLPKERQQPAPAIIYCCGHTELGFRSETYQQVIINLVSKGFVVLAFDPLGQGERLQYVDPETGKSKIGGPTKEHSYAGIQTLITGTSLTDYFIWDGIRAVDYLETRPEVDMTRIGITGRSGGGTQTAMIAACDERIYAAAPENYITSFKRLLQSIGPQDAEQNPYKAIAKGFDHPDFLHTRAPKPTLLLTTTNDFFSIQGARETFTEAKKSFTAFGKPENIQMTEDYAGHQSTKNNRESLYAFFQNHLNLPGESTDYAVTPFSIKELWVTPTGQVATSFENETIFNLNKKYFPGKSFTGNNLPEQVAETSGIDGERKLTAAVYTGNFFENDVEVERYFLENDKSDYALPVYILQRENSNPEKLVVWLHPEGKEKVMEEPLLNKVLAAGYTIISADLPGTGELHDPIFSGDGTVMGVSFNYTFGANLAGKSIPGIQAEAIDLLMQFIAQESRFSSATKTAIIQGLAASPFLHFEVLNKKFAKATFMNFPEPAINLVENMYFNPEDAFYVVPGSLPHFDLSDLANHLQKSGTKISMTKNTSDFDVE